MQADIKNGNAFLNAGQFLKARESFRHALGQGLTEIEERVCRNRLREVEQKIKQLSSVARIELRQDEEAGTVSCSVRIVSREISIQHMIKKVFTIVNQTSPEESAELRQTGNALTALWTGPGGGIVCGTCKRFREMVKDNIGRDGFLEEGKCIFE